MQLICDESTWADYLWWHVQDRKALKQINRLITDVAHCSPMPVHAAGQLGPGS